MSKIKRSTIEPSKYTSLEKLKKIQRDHYLGNNKSDYNQDEVDKLIMLKQSQNADKAIDAEVDKWDEYEEFLQAEQNRRA